VASIRAGVRRRGIYPMVHTMTNTPTPSPTPVIESTSPELQNLRYEVAVKRPIPIRVSQLEEETIVVTTHGPARADAGDWLAIGVDGEVYPIANSVFERTYDFIDPAATDRVGVLIVDTPFCNDPAYTQMFGHIYVEEHSYDPATDTALYYARSAQFEESDPYEPWPEYAPLFSDDPEYGPRFVRFEKTSRVHPPVCDFRRDIVGGCDDPR